MINDSDIMKIENISLFLMIDFVIEIEAIEFFLCIHSARLIINNRKIDCTSIIIQILYFFFL